MTPEMEKAHDVKYIGSRLMENGAACYWLFSHNRSTAEYLMESVHDDFAQLAKALGYDIAKIAEEAPEEEAV